MFVDYSGLERYTDINASFGKLVNTYCCFQRCEAISEQLEILKSLVPKCHDIVALTDEDFASGHTAGLTQKLFAMAMTLHQITDCIDLLQKCNTIIPIEIANPASFESGAVDGAATSKLC
ncbi:AIF_collapsed_G0026590.mRNA.1.CDS.1 [Saccharomyces cerevisiae]|nr:AIF_collapsed_G0026590.mRNA.1.CDS.1 [Saccharomyces cerevisiae]